MTDLVDLVADANVYIDAVVHDDRRVLGDPPSFARVPSLPPRSVHPALHMFGVVRDSANASPSFALHVSDHILAMIAHALVKHWQPDRIHEFIVAIKRLARLSGGGYHESVPRTQHDSRDHEDNLVLDLAAHTDAAIIVSNDSDLLILGRPSGWKGRAIIAPQEFTARADVAARHR